MGTINDKLDKLNQTKTNIKNELRRKGADVKDSDTFASYEGYLHDLEIVNAQAKTVNPNTSSQTVLPDSEYNALSQVTVNAVQTETKNVKSTTTSQTVTPSAGKFINEITVEPMDLEQITINPSTSQQIITPSQNKDGISQVIASPVTSAIDQNIQSSNIKAGITILNTSGKSSVVDTETATAQSKDIVQGKTAYANGQLVEGTCDWQNIEWTPQPDWWDIKTIVENDTEDYPIKIIALHDDGARSIKWQWVQSNADRLIKIKFSDGQEITSSQKVKIADNGFKNCSKGYKTFYSIWYFSNVPNFYNKNLGQLFENSRYVYFYNCSSFFGFSSTYWASTSDRWVEAIESNITISTQSNNFSLILTDTIVLHKLPNYVWNRVDNPAPNVIQFSNVPNLDYKNISNIIKNRGFNFSSGQAPMISSAFFGEIIDFENDWGINTSLFTKTNAIIGPNGVRKLDFTNITSTTGNLRVTNVYEVCNIKISNNYFNGIALSYETLIRVLNALWDYSESEDTYTLTISADNLSKLTDDDKAIATNKRMDTSIIGGRKMKLIIEEKYNILKADEGKHIRGVSDVYKPAYYDENNEYIEEHIPDYFEMAYVPKKITEENMHNKYIEEDI